LIQEKAIERGLSETQLAEAIGCCRTNVYKIYQRKSIDTEQLIRISKALDFNFIKEVYLCE
jgi:DNA-binding Xre family transcriptional regulator